MSKTENLVLTAKYNRVSNVVLIAFKNEKYYVYKLDLRRFHSVKYLFTAQADGVSDWVQFESCGSV